MYRYSVTGTSKSTLLDLGSNMCEIKRQIGRKGNYLSNHHFSSLLYLIFSLHSFSLHPLFLKSFFCSSSFSSHAFFSTSSCCCTSSCLHLSRSSRTAWTPSCPEIGCCGIPYLVVSMHSPSTQLTLPSSLFTMPYWVSVDLVTFED